ncbi:DUF3472 domain-containing protein [Sphingobacterium sp. SRCM116780]|uniref:DUF3472 domain-containing protein n=1 Tax=Sphingobacterium sp. SRCM116780 TaxID=2907623 RepID=UPI001F19B11B|nr:RICIN domain-containing protein [Sphingobacterium sp. SRCM116780]UIR57429.1 DUF3472 domain-containing protein [Sphingobacterium sp. SRCM116780]
MRKLCFTSAFIAALTTISCSKEIVKSPLENPSGLTSQSDKDLPNLILTGSNAAPSQHLVYSFANDAVLKMSKIKITNTAKTEYFSVLNYDGGYMGLQDTPDPNFGTSNIMLASLWDKNTAANNLAFYSYLDSKTIPSRFGGEGDGQKTVNPYNWSVNTWYNMVIRSWKENGKIYIANFVQDLSTGKWLHTSTVGREASAGYLGSGSGTFLENWIGDNPSYDGRFHRKAFLKDTWNLSVNNVWEKSTSRYFSANDNDAGRNGQFDRAFNVGYSSTEDAYFMEHGGSTTPDPAFGTGRVLDLPAQTNQGSAPVLTTIENSYSTARYHNNKLIISWGINETKSPQLSYKLELLNATGTVLQTQEKIKPEKRIDTLSSTLATGNYTVRITLTDIFNQQTPAKLVPVTVFNANDTYKIKNLSSGKYLSILSNSTANSAQVVQSTSSTSNFQKWKIVAGTYGYALVNVGSSKSIDIPGSIDDINTGLIQYTNSTNQNQQWTFNFLETSNNVFIRTTLSKGFIIDNPGSSTADNTQVVLYSINNNTGTNNQRWVLEKQ